MASQHLTRTEWLVVVIGAVKATWNTPERLETGSMRPNRSVAVVLDTQNTDEDMEMVLDLAV